MAPLYPVAGLGAATALVAVVPLNGRLFDFLRRTGGARFAMACFSLHVLHHLCAGAGFVWAWAEHYLARTSSKRFPNGMAAKGSGLKEAAMTSDGAPRPPHRGRTI